MKRTFILCLLLLSLLPTAHAEDQPASKDKPQPAATTAPTKKLVPKLVDFSELKFANPEQAAHVQLWQTTAMELADETWERGRWCQPEGIPDFRTWWSANPGIHDPFGYGTAPRPPGKAGHNIWIYATGDVSKQDPLVQRIRLSASWQPAESGWGAQFWYNEGADPRFNSENFGFQVLHWTAGEKWEYGNRLLSDKHLSTYVVMREIEGTQYYVEVRSLAKVANGKYSSADMIKAWLVSPDNFRVSALRRLDFLKKVMESELSTNRWIDARLSAPDGQPISRYRLKKSTRPLSMRERNQLLATAQEELARRKKLIEENYKEMHAALIKTFPLLEFLESMEK